MDVPCSGEGMRAKSQPFAFGVAVERDVQYLYSGTCLKRRQKTENHMGYRLQRRNIGKSFSQHLLDEIAESEW